MAVCARYRTTGLGSLMQMAAVAERRLQVFLVCFKSDSQALRKRLYRSKDFGLAETAKCHTQVIDRSS